MSESGFHDDDGAPDEPPTGGFDDARHDRRLRTPGRRNEDLIAVGWEVWAARFALHRGKLTALVAILTYLFTSLGFRVLGPSQDIKALDLKFTVRDSIMAVRVTRLEDRNSAITMRLDTLANQLRFVTFLQCYQLRRADPELAVDGCPRKP